MDPVRYRILGTTQALRTDGSPVPVGGARLRALLTVLALRPGRAVPAVLLVDEVWDDDLPADATGALQALVGRLRRTLGADTVESVDGGYRLAAAPDDVDLHHFERLAAEGLAALADGDPAKAAVVLDDALALWHGPALADLPDRTAEAARWETRRLDVRRARLAAALALGHGEQHLPELTALCDLHPLDEPLQALRLRALRDAGRTAEALAAYEDVRRLLADRLGSDPGPELRSLHGELLRSQEAVPSRALPHARTAEPEGALPAPAHPGNLRARLTSFVGRDADIDTLRDDLAGARLVTLLGPGGAGKTRLSQEAAEAVAHLVPDGVWLAELAPVDDPQAVPEAVLTAVGARETVLRGAGAEEMRAAAERHDDPLVRLAEHCARRRMLLILDNCEHVVDAAARLVEHLLQHSPGLTVLATSREPLGVPGESLRPVEPLPQPYALKLLADRGAAARPGFRIEDDPEAAAEICRRLDGLPLAIELAAARLRMLSPRQIADRLDDRFRLLTSGSRTVLPRQQTLRAVVDWSWDLLDTDERTVLRRLSVFSGGCDLTAAEAVCGPIALEALGSLVDKSLVVAAPSGDGEMRYRLLETVAEYAGERLEESGERADAERAHLTYYRELVRTTDPLLRASGQGAAIDRLELEYENLRTALRRAVATRDEHEALCLLLSLAWYWQMHDQRTEARTWSTAVIALGPDPFTAPARPVPDIAETCTDSPPPMRPEILEEARRGAHLVHLACMDMDHKAWETPQAKEKLRVISETYRPGQPQTCRMPGFLWFFAVLFTADLDRMRAVIDESVRTCRELGYTWELGQTLQMRANILANRSTWAGDATRDAEEALEIFRRIDDAWGAAEALSARGEAHERRGDLLLAAADFEAARAYAERLGARTQMAVLDARLGSVLLDAGETERGERLLRRVVEDSHGSSSDAMPAARLFLTMWLGRTERVAEAREQLELLRRDFGAVGFVVFDGIVLGLEAWLDTIEERYDEAAAKVRTALVRASDRMTRVVAPHLPSVHLCIGAVVLAGLDGGRRARDAARCLGAADRLLPPGHFRAPSEQEIRAEAEARVRALLGDAAYEAGYAEGDGLSLEEAVTLV
ncbi:BTAD domain-containing putative transcriptional regulator [Streptomyces chiangmaiensis]|uniref:BTAD domain-containing putative transcriptional regulator n=1 Tax=Streptomyces chiangmaiensis TaxID=766497 RepID=A0ABU7FI35_9ACTN|nr:BTAD domain-containing putative transcriptional regulator [Streptomyces chiangmaiensis]MED7823651.1 BTAD domain-containing putative transcriptional regulator [Streptomyces chiangmaiensis]